MGCGPHRILLLLTPEIGSSRLPCSDSTLQTTGDAHPPSTFNGSAVANNTNLAVQRHCLAETPGAYSVPSNRRDRPGWETAQRSITDQVETGKLAILVQMTADVVLNRRFVLLARRAGTTVTMPVGNWQACFRRGRMNSCAGTTVLNGLGNWTAPTDASRLLRFVRPVASVVDPERSRPSGRPPA